jgi:hypothetical protein
MRGALGSIWLTMSGAERGRFDQLVTKGIEPMEAAQRIIDARQPVEVIYANDPDTDGSDASRRDRP